MSRSSFFSRATEVADETVRAAMAEKNAAKTAFKDV